MEKVFVGLFVVCNVVVCLDRTRSWRLGSNMWLWGFIDVLVWVIRFFWGHSLGHSWDEQGGSHLHWSWFKALQDQTTLRAGHPAPRTEEER